MQILNVLKFLKDKMTRHDWFVMLSELQLNSVEDLINLHEDKEFIKRLNKEYDKRRTFNDMSFFLEPEKPKEKPVKIDKKFKTWLEYTSNDD